MMCQCGVIWFSCERHKYVAEHAEGLRLQDVTRTSEEKSHGDGEKQAEDEEEGGFAREEGKRKLCRGPKLWKKKKNKPLG